MRLMISSGGVVDVVAADGSKGSTDSGCVVVIIVDAVFDTVD